MVLVDVRLGAELTVLAGGLHGRNEGRKVGGKRRVGGTKREGEGEGEGEGER